LGVVVLILGFWVFGGSSKKTLSINKEGLVGLFGVKVTQRRLERVSQNRKRLLTGSKLENAVLPKNKWREMQKGPKGFQPVGFKKSISMEQRGKIGRKTRHGGGHSRPRSQRDWGKQGKPFTPGVANGKGKRKRKIVQNTTIK